MYGHLSPARKHMSSAFSASVPVLSEYEKEDEIYEFTSSFSDGLTLHGDTAFTDMPCGATSFASSFVIAISAPLVAE